MSDDFNQELSRELDTARKKRVESFQLNFVPNMEEYDDDDEQQETETFENIIDNTDNDENSVVKVEDNKKEKPKKKNKKERFRFDDDFYKSMDMEVEAEPEVEEYEEDDTEPTSKMMADDFSEKYSLHKYTDAEQIEDYDNSENGEFDGEERVVSDGSSDDGSGEISSFSNKEQKYVMDREERKALKRHKKEEKARIKEKADKNGCLFRFIWLCMVTAVAVVLGMFIWNGVSDLLGINRPADGDKVIIDISEDTTFDQIVDMLLSNKLIENEGFFRLYATVTKSTDGFEEGIYTMRPNMDYQAILSLLQSGNRLTETVSLQFKEGMTVREIAQALEDKKVCKANKFLEYCNSDEFDDEYSFLKEIPKRENRVYKLEGYLFPDTYEFYIGEDADDTVRRFLNNFQYKICEETSNISGYTDAVTIERVIKDRGYVLDDIINLASIIQAEAANTTDMYAISSVFYNRLATMSSGGVSPFGDADLDKLKSDATLYYPYSSEEDIPQDIASTFKSNYNTYNISGMPPGAICNPGTDAIDAAINPDSTQYYYFCHKAATASEPAVAYYASTFEDHERNIAEAGLS